MRSKDSIVTAEHAWRRAICALFFLGFAEAWLLSGLGTVAGSHGLARVLIRLLGGILTVLALDLMRRAKSLPAGASDAVDAERSRRMFRAVNIILWVSVATAAAILSILHLPEYLVTAIAILVGLHLFPLAGSLRTPQYYVTGGLLVLLPLVCLATLPRAEVSGVTALAAGAVLLLSAAVTLVQNLGMLRPQGERVTRLAGHL